MYPIDSAYNLIQSLLNKDQRGKVRPKDFNWFSFQALYKLYADLFSQFRVIISKQNRFFTGQGLAKEAHYTIQQLEYYMQTSNKLDVVDTRVILSQAIPDENHIAEITTEKGVLLEIVEAGYFNLIQTHRYNTSCSPCYRLESDKIYVSKGIDKIIIHYLRKPKKPNWAYIEIGGQPVFNPGSPDFSDFDIHTSLLSMLIVEIASLAGISIREPEVVQVMNQDKNMEIQKDTLV
jgi:hypothetical protein